MDGYRNLTVLVLGVLLMCDLCICHPPAHYKGFVYKICNGDLDPDQADFKSCLENIFKYLPQDTVRYNFNFYENSRHVNTLCYAHGVCNQALLKSHCISCLQAAIKGADGQCGWSIGVQFQLNGCRLRFEKYGFIEDGH